MLIIRKEDIDKAFSMKEAIEASKLAFKIFNDNKAIVPLRTNISSKQNGSMLFMPSYIPEINKAGIKIVSVFSENKKKGLPVTPGKILLLDDKTGDVVALLDGTYVTALRTGAASGAAFDLLAKKDARMGAIIGTGGQAYTQLEAMLTARKLEEVRVYSNNKEEAIEFYKQARELYPNTIISLTDCAKKAVEDADLIALCTTATSPVFEAKDIKEGATISAIGGFTPQMQEIDPFIFKKTSKIFLDSKEAVLSEAGDILNPLADKIISEANLLELGDLILGNVTGRESEKEIIVFKTVGIAVQDLVCASEIYEKVKAVDGGIKIDI